MTRPGFAPAVRRRAGALGLVLVCAVSFELTTRILDWVRYRMPILSRVTGEEELMLRDRDGAHGRPNAQYRKWAMDSLGFRGPDVPVHAARGTVRIVVAGASETFGLYESPNKEYARELEDTLNERLAAGECAGSSTVRFEVLNDALPGMSLATAKQDIRNRLGRFAPDIIIYYPSPAQYLEDRLPIATPPDSLAPKRSVERSPLGALHPRSLEFVRDELRQLAPEPMLNWFRERAAGSERRKHPAAWVFSSVPHDRLLVFDADLRSLIGAVRSDGAEPVIATHATAFERHMADSAERAQSWERFYPRANGATIIAFDDSASATTMRAASDSGLVPADVHAMFARTQGDNFVDFVHFTDVGSARVAHVLAEAALTAAGRRHECRP
ncbi:MAG TPA: hypothetical protein VIM15_13630 [Gemmatimonadaceae bacterium]